jgi:hypothetical protein
MSGSASGSGALTASGLSVSAQNGFLAVAEVAEGAFDGSSNDGISGGILLYLLGLELKRLYDIEVVAGRGLVRRRLRSGPGRSALFTLKSSS